MELGQHYQSNQKRLDHLKERDWLIALAKCKEHIKLKLKQKTLYGAHSGSNLGADPVDHYLSLAYEKLLSGDWEWKEEFSLSEQMIRIVNSYISKEVDRCKSKKAESFKVEYRDIETDFYNIGEDAFDSEELQEFESKIRSIEEAIYGDNELEFLWEALKEGKKRSEIANLLEIQPKQLDKLKEKLIRRVRNNQSSGG